MPKKEAYGLQNTTDTDQEHSISQVSSSKVPGSPDRFLTLALPADWEYAYQWATSAGIIDELLLLLNATLIREMPNDFGSVLVPLTSPLARDTLLVWEQADSLSESLRRVSDAVMAVPEILVKYPPLPTEKKAAVQFRGDTEAFYLMTLLTERLPACEKNDKDWFVTLRLWLYRHAIERAISGNVQDINLRLASSKLRMASEDGNNWRQFFLLLKTSQIEIDPLETFLIFRASQLIDRRSKNELTDLQVSVLKALRSIARHEEKIDKKQDSSIPQLLPMGLIEDTRSKAKVNQLSLMEAEDEDDGDFEEIKRLQFNEDETMDLVQMPVDEQRSLSQQKIYGNSVLLYAAEELAYLPWSWNKPNRHELPLLEKLIKDLVKSEDVRERFLGAVCWIAVACGRSFRRSLVMLIGTQPVEEWTIDYTRSILQRSPPHRIPGWAPKNQKEQDWVKPQTSHHSIKLPESVDQTIKECIRQNLNVQVLGDLWRLEWGVSIESLLRQHLDKLVPRVTPGMFSSVLPLRVFEESLDSTFSRLVSSHPNSGLPGSCSYASWNLTQVDKAFHTTTPIDSTGFDPNNVIAAYSTLIRPLIPR